MTALYLCAETHVHEHSHTHTVPHTNVTAKHNLV